jgi:hypothetical protein
MLENDAFGMYRGCQIIDAGEEKGGSFKRRGKESIA